MFELPPGHAAHALLEGQDIEIGDELILRRVQLADGRTRAYVNDQSVSAQALRSLASALVEIHGQHDERALTDPATHRALVDAYGGAGRAGQRRFREALRRCARPRQRSRPSGRGSPRRRRRPNSPATPMRNCRGLAVQPGEEEALAARRQAMMQGEKVAADIREARDHLTGRRRHAAGAAFRLPPAAAPACSRRRL